MLKWFKKFGKKDKEDKEELEETTLECKRNGKGTLNSTIIFK